MTATLSKFSAYFRTGSIDKARRYALAYEAVVAFCSFDGMFYVVSWADFQAGPFVHGSPLPIPKREAAR